MGEHSARAWAELEGEWRTRGWTRCTVHLDDHKNPGADSSGQGNDISGTQEQLDNNNGGWDINASGLLMKD